MVFLRSPVYSWFAIFLVNVLLVAIRESDAQDCRCSQIDACMQDQSFSRRTVLLSCRQQCMDSFIKGNRQKIMECYNPRDDKFLTVSQQMIDCMEGQLGRPCIQSNGNNNQQFKGRRKRVAYGIMGQMFGLDYPQAVKDFERCTISCMKVNGTSPGPLMMSFSSGRTRKRSVDDFIEESHSRLKRATAIGSNYHSCADQAGCTLVSMTTSAGRIRNAVVQCLNELPLNTDEELTTYCQCMATANIGPVDCVMDQNPFQVIRVPGGK